MKKLTIEEIGYVLNMFQFIAPMYVHHHSGVMVLREAKMALSKLKRQTVETNPYLSHFDIPDILACRNIESDGIRVLVWDSYNKLLRFMISDALPTWSFYVDENGAYGFKDRWGIAHLLGDTNGHFAHYLRASELQRSIGLFLHLENHRLIRIDEEVLS